MKKKFKKPGPINHNTSINKNINYKSNKYYYKSSILKPTFF